MWFDALTHYMIWFVLFMLQLGFGSTPNMLAVRWLSDFSKVCPENRKHLSRSAVNVPLQTAKSRSIQTLRSCLFSRFQWTWPIQIHFACLSIRTTSRFDSCWHSALWFEIVFFETWIKLRICSCFCTKQCAGAQFNLELWILSHFRLAALCWVSQSCHLARIVLLLLHASSANALGALILVARVGTRSLWSRKDPMPSVPIASTWTSPARSTLKWRLMCCKSS
jgi:hypothetical protein